MNFVQDFLRSNDVNRFLSSHIFIHPDFPPSQDLPSSLTYFYQLEARHKSMCSVCKMIIKHEPLVRRKGERAQCQEMFSVCLKCSKENDV